ncbi:MAG: DUF2782 domain-containing protein [Pseudomonadota bacterium]|nr:DUF2782 domain-containing protein [Pseudomonadota bacterium]
MKQFLLILMVLLLPQSGVIAQEASGAAEPEVVITPRGDDSRVKEYRVNGRLYMVEVAPAKGPHYFLVDSDGDGTLETRQNGPLTGVEVPRWTLLKW